MTFSIVAFDPAEDALGVAVASKFLAVGAVVAWAEAGKGAVATQAFAKIGFGPDGLALLGAGQSAEETLAQLLDEDPRAPDRQVGIVDARGGAAAHTGMACFDWAGHIVGEGFTCQGNILTGPEVVQAMADAFRAASGPLEDRLFAALTAGDRAGGDRRGRQSAAILVVKPGGGYGGDTDRYLDLRVDDHPDPVPELGRLLRLHRLYFGRPDPADLLPIDDALARELQTLMRRLGYYQADVTGQWDEASKAAFWALVGSENLEERWSPETTPDRLDRVALAYLRERYGA
ncbi:MAG: DUF1028 domain-containing protein [Candidatus Flexifilum sp.]